MTVRFYSARQGLKSRLIERFLLKYQVQHELVEASEISRGREWLLGKDEVPALEVDGELFIDPNDEALRVILDVD
jgi:hypothetical protein